MRRTCGAHARTTGRPCQAPGIGKGGRCKMHGGASTGPRTAKGRQRISELMTAKWEKLRQERPRLVPTVTPRHERRIKQANRLAKGMAYAEALYAQVQTHIDAKKKACAVSTQWLADQVAAQEQLRPLQQQVHQQLERYYPEVAKAAASIERQPNWVQRRLANDAQREAEQRRGRELAELYPSTERRERPRFAIGSRHRR